MFENESQDKFPDRRGINGVHNETGTEKVTARINRLRVKRKGGDTLLGIDLGVDVPKDPPAVVRLPAQAAWRAFGLAIGVLGFEMVIDGEN
jgi:hypothetical protein